MAHELITEGNTLILDVGSTAREFAQLLKKRKNLTVITPSPEHSMEFAGNYFIKLIVSGGIVRVGVMSIIYPISENTIKEFNVDKSYIDAGEIDLNVGLTEYNAEEAQIKKSIIGNCKESIVLANSIKLGNVTFSKVIRME